MYLRYHISSYFNFLYTPWHWGNQIYRYFHITHLFNPQSAFVILTKMFKIICINANTEIFLREINTNLNRTITTFMAWNNNFKMSILSQTDLQTQCYHHQNHIEFFCVKINNLVLKFISNCKKQENQVNLQE